MNLLLDRLPSTVIIDEVEYKINTDFRVSILFSELMQDGRLGPTEKLMQTFKLYLDVIPHDPKEALKSIMWFYRCGVELTEEDLEKSKDKPTPKKMFDYSFDANLFYAAYLQQYNINLQKDNLHWWEFQALFEGLQDCKLTEVMKIRGTKINKDMSDSEKKYYREMKNLYMLPDFRTEEEKEADFNQSLNQLF